MSLAKQILNNKSTGRGNCDEFGIPLQDGRGEDVTHRPQYLVARALLTEQLNPDYDSATTHRLHMRNDMLYNYNKEVQENHKNFYKLTGVEYHVSSALQMRFWEELKKFVPKLDTSIYKVCDGLWWDKKSGKVLIGGDDEIRELAAERNQGLRSGYNVRYW